MTPILIGPKGFVTCGVEQIYYESYGEGEPIVLCHGKGGNHAIWYQQIPNLAQSYRVITWDQRGFGRSTNVTMQSSPTVAVDDLFAIMDALDVERAHLVGQSMGGWAVLGAALQKPARVLSLTLANSIAGITTPEIALMYEHILAQRLVQQPVTHLSMEGHAVLAEQTVEENLTRAFLYEQIGKSHGPAPVTMSLLLKRTCFDSTEVAKLIVPTLFITGEFDIIFPPKMIQLAAACMQQAEVVEIPCADHSPYFETPQVWNTTLRNFLSRVSEA